MQLNSTAPPTPTHPLTPTPNHPADLSYPVLAVSIDRRSPDHAGAAAAAGALLGASPAKPAVVAAAAAVALGTAAGGSPAGLLAARGQGATAVDVASMAGPEAKTAAAATAAAAAGQQGQQERQRWVSMEATPGSRLGLLHWGQVGCAGLGRTAGQGGRRQPGLPSTQHLLCGLEAIARSSF